MAFGVALSCLRRSIFLRAMASALLVTLLIVGAIGGGAYHFVRNQMVDDAELALYYESRQHAQEVAGRLRALYANASSLATNSLVANALVDSMGRQVYLEPFLQGFSRLDSLRIDVVLTDFQGQPIAGSRAADPALALPPEWTEQVVDRGQPLARVSGAGDDAVLVVAAPVYYANTGLPEGALVFRTRLNDLAAMENHAFIGPHTMQIITAAQGPEGEPAFEWTADEIAVIMPIDALPLFDDLALAIEIGADRAIAEAPLRELTRTTGAIAAAVLVLIVPASFLVARKVTRRLRALESAASSVVGQQSFGTRFAVSGEDEIARLGHAFNRMLERLESAHQALEAQADRELETSQRRFQSVVTTAVDAIVVVDPEGAVSFWNAGAERIFGFAEGDILGKPITEIIPERYREAHEAAFKRLGPGIPSRFDGQTAELVGRRGDGTEFPVEMSLTEWYAGDERFFTGILRDVSERRQFEQSLETACREAEEANKAKSAFLAAMSHEIRTPMNGVIGMTGLLLDTALSPEQRYMAETIRDSGEALLGLINDVLDFSKIEAGKVELEPGEFDLVSLIDGTVDLLALSAERKGIELVTVFDAGVPRQLYGDGGRVRQILINLLGNAVKFTEAGGVTLTVTARERTDKDVRIRFKIRDTGIGIPAEHLPDLFREFCQIGSSTMRRQSGTGLGLAISKQLCALMGGTIGADSAVGRGSTFWFEVPLGITGIQPGRDFDTGLACRALVVQSSQLAGQGLAAQLRKWGMAAELVQTAAEAAVRLAGEPFDVVFLDHDLAEDPCLEAGLRTAGKPHRVLLMPRHAVGAGAAGGPRPLPPADARLVKPLQLSPLFDTVATLLGTRVCDVGQDGRGTPRLPASEDSAEPPMRILVAEDNAVNQQVALRLLKNRGHHVDVVGDGREAVRAVSSLPYDLVLMDVQMPEMDGLAATRAIRALPGPAGRVPIVAMTATVTNGFAETCRAAGMTDFVGKPINRKVLHAALRRFAGSATTAPQPEPVPPRYEKEIDGAVVADLVALFGKDDARRLVDQMREQEWQRLRAIERLAVSRDAAGVASEAHSFKSAVGSLGLAAAQSLAAQAEAAAAAEDWAAVDAAVAQLQRAFASSLVCVECGLEVASRRGIAPAS